MTTYQVFNEQQTAVTPAAADTVPIYDASAGIMGKATVASLNSGGGGARVTGTSLSVTAALHAGGVIDVAAAAPIAITMPAATGTRDTYTFVISVLATGTPHVISALSTDIIAGTSMVVTTTSSNTEGWATSATSDKISLNGTTKGGLVGDKVVMIDMASGVWQIAHTGAATGTEATPFDAT